jgi:hypothetical protein
MTALRSSIAMNREVEEWILGGMRKLDPERHAYA